MHRNVVKFGGSNLKCKSDLQKIITAVKSYENPPVIVVSALYGITDKIIGIIKNIHQKETSVQDWVSEITVQYIEVLNENIGDINYRAKIISEIEKRAEKLTQFLQGIQCIEETPDFLSDRILSYGERFSSVLLTGILNFNGLKSGEILPEEIPLFTDGEFGNASVDFEKSAPGISNLFPPNTICVVPGFYGVSSEYKVTLFGRGGSDYSAAALARLLNAKTLDVWKDVDGFMSSDPRLIKTAQKIDKLTYKEAAELAYFGAAILHPRAVEPLIEAKIPIRIFNINKADEFNALTEINCHENHHSDIIKSVTFSEDFGVLKLKGPGVGIKPGILAKVTTLLDEKNINIRSVITSQIAINILLSAKDLQKAFETVSGMNLQAISEIQQRDGISVIATVGEGILEKPGIAARIFSAVARKNINIEMIAFGASQVSAYFLLAKEDCFEAVSEIHDEFFTNPGL